jgi:nucleoside-diphosphate-sugar epimerase
MESKMTKRALICGAGGFIGSHLVKRLRKKAIGCGEWILIMHLFFLKES